MVNRYLVVVAILIISLLIIGGASAAKDKTKVANHSYKHVEVNGVIELVKSLLGVDVKENYYEVVVNGGVVAEIPEDSVLLGMTIHDACLPHQYGTERWRKCEVPLQ